MHNLDSIHHLFLYTQACTAARPEADDVADDGKVIWGGGDTRVELMRSHTYVAAELRLGIGVAAMELHVIYDE